MSFVNKMKKGNVNYDINDARIPEISAEDIGKVLGVTENGIEPVEAGGGFALYKHTLALKNMYDEDVEIVVISAQSESYGSNASLENITLNLFQDFYFGSKFKQEYASEYILYYDTILSIFIDPNEGDSFLCVGVIADSAYSILCPMSQTATDIVTEL